MATIVLIGAHMRYLLIRRLGDERGSIGPFMFTRIRRCCDSLLHSVLLSRIRCTRKVNASVRLCEKGESKKRESIARNVATVK